MNHDGRHILTLLQYLYCRIRWIFLYVRSILNRSHQTNEEEAVARCRTRVVLLMLAAVRSVAVLLGAQSSTASFPSAAARHGHEAIAIRPEPIP